MCQELILSWEDVKTHQWFPIGRFSKSNNVYSFSYIQGVIQAKQQGFSGLASMQDFEQTYHYGDIFPLLKNRIFNKSRADRDEFLDWLNIKSENSDFEELAKTGGIKATDNLQLFPVPIKKDNKYILEFFVQGTRHLPPNTQKRIEKLNKNEKIFLCADLENPQDENALILRTEDPVEIVGYCPKFFAKDFKKLFDLSKSSFTIKIKKVNKNAPKQLELLCEITCDWHKDFSPFLEDKFKSINQ
ncbi:MAG: hypothetical protein FE834_02250 [Gammaproteobacteria bacterium]|nr:hypothetical protein [Gammaproteobacteria bacterium]